MAAPPAVPAAIPLRGSRTEKNLAAAFAGETMARTRYTFWASKAKKEGFEQIAEIFIETAENEKEHAKRFYKLIKGEGSALQVQLGVAVQAIATTALNLKAAADNELEEHSQTYPHWAAVAEQEGFDEIAKVFRVIASVEREHEQRFRLLQKQVEDGTVFKRDREVFWKCRNCGYVVQGLEAPAECPACGHPQGWYEMREVLE
jgi:rubrerythrin